MTPERRQKIFATLGIAETDNNDIWSHGTSWEGEPFNELLGAIPEGYEVVDGRYRAIKKEAKPETRSSYNGITPERRQEILKSLGIGGQEDDGQEQLGPVRRESDIWDDPTQPETRSGNGITPERRQEILRSLGIGGQEEESRESDEREPDKYTPGIDIQKSEKTKASKADTAPKITTPLADAGSQYGQLSSVLPAPAGVDTAKLAQKSPLDTFMEQKLPDMVDTAIAEGGKRYAQNKSRKKSFGERVSALGEQVEFGAVKELADIRSEAGPEQVMANVVKGIAEEKALTDTISQIASGDEEYAKAKRSFDSTVGAGDNELTDEEVQKIMDSLTPEQKAEAEKEIELRKKKIEEEFQKVNTAYGNAYSRAASSVEERIKGEIINILARRNMPASEAEAFGRILRNNSFFGMAQELAIEKLAGGHGLSRQIEQTSIEMYDPATLTRILGGVAALAADTPVFGAGGMLGEAGARAVTKAATKMVARDIMKRAPQLAKGTATEIAGRLAASNRLTQALASSVASAGTLGTYDTLASVTEQAIGGDVDIAEVLKAAGRGTATGAIIGPIGSLTGNLTRRYGLDNAGDIAAKVSIGTGGLLAENAAFVGMGSLFDSSENGAGTAEAFAEGLATLGIMKGLSAIRNGINRRNSYAEKLLRDTEFTKGEMDALNAEGIDARSYKRAVYDLLTSRNERLLGEQRDKVLADYDRIMASENIPATAKIKLQYLVKGTIPAGTPRPVDVTVDAREDGRFEVVQRDPAGNIITKDIYDNRRDADYAVREGQHLRDMNAVLYYGNKLDEMRYRESLFEAAKRLSEYENGRYEDYIGVVLKASKKETLTQSESRTLRNIVETARPILNESANATTTILRNIADRHSLTQKELERAIARPVSARSEKERLAVEDLASSLRRVVTQTEETNRQAREQYDADARREQLKTPEQKQAEAERDEIVRQAEEAVDAQIERATNVSDGNIYTVRLDDANGSQVTVRNGHIAFNNQTGEVDTALSDPTVVVEYADGHSKMVSVRDIAYVEDMLPAEQAKNEVHENIRAGVAEAERQGRIAEAVTNGQAVTLADGREGTIVAQNQDGSFTFRDANGEESAITAEEITDAAYDKKPVSGGSIDIDPEPAGKQNGTAPLQNGLSEDRDSENLSVRQTDIQAGQTDKASALSRIPVGQDGSPMYERVDAGTAWDAIVEQLNGDETIAARIADSMLRDKQEALKRLEKSNPRKGTTVAEKIAAERERMDAIERANADVKAWQRIVAVPQERQQTVEAERMEQVSNVKLSNVTDENGLPFVFAPSGALEFGKIDEETGLKPAPILLSKGVVTNPKTKSGYGLAHIEARHGDQIRNAGFKSVVDFIEEVAKNYERIKEGNIRNGRPTYILQIKDRHNNTLMVELSSDGNYWNVNTAGIFKESYGKNKKEVYSRHTTAKQSVETVEASQEVKQSDTTTSSRMNAPTTSSENKDTDITVNSKNTDEKISQAEAEVETNPTDGQKEAGNYRKGHVRIDGLDITIEQPKGSVRRGTDKSGKAWETTMRNTYGYIRGTQGVDDDHIDVFLSDSPTEGNVYIVDQKNADGNFDEHKVMYGFGSEEEARKAYLSNYEKGWRGLGSITEVSKDEFRKWIDSSHRKTKPFAEYKNVKKSIWADVKPVGVGAFGNIYDQFKGKVRDAIEFLRSHESGDLLGVSHRDGFGDVDYVWGDKSGGLAHIIDKHVGNGKSFPNIDDAAKEIDSIIQNGELAFENGDKAVFRTGNKLVTVRKNLREKGKKIADKNWVLTAYDETSADNASAISDANQAQAARGTAVSDSKDSKKTTGTQPATENIPPHLMPKMLKDAYESGNAEDISRAETAMREFIMNTDDMRKVAETYRLSIERVRSEEKGSPTHRMNDFVATATKELLKKNGMGVLTGIARKRLEAAKESTDTALLDILAGDREFNVREAVIRNPNTGDDTLRRIAAESAYGTLRQEAENALAARSIGPVDAQGNPVDEHGNLRLEKIFSIDELTDKDFTAPTRNVELPHLPQNVADAIGTNGRPVIIKKNIFEKNHTAHSELTPEQGREILGKALYNTTFVGQAQPIRRPDYWVAVQTSDKNAITVLEVNSNKDNVEIVGWRRIDSKGLSKLRRQAEREGGQFLILTSEDAAAALSALPSDMPSASKGSKRSANSQPATENIPPHLMPKMLKDAYESGNAEDISRAETAMREFIMNTDDMRKVAETYRLSIERVRSEEKGSPTHRMNDFVATATKELLKKNGMGVLTGIAKKRIDAAKESTDAALLDILAGDREFSVREAVIYNPNTGADTLRRIAAESAYDTLRQEAENALVARSMGPVDAQGNPVDEHGNLRLEKIFSIDELTDGDFTAPTRNVDLPHLPQNVADALGTQGKPVIIKKNIFEKNSKQHQYTPEENRNILSAALYTPTTYGQSKPKTRPEYRVAIKQDIKSPITVLEISDKKDNVEIVSWYTLSAKDLKRLERQVEREDGELLILTPENDAAASLSTLPSDMPSASKGSKRSANSQPLAEKIEDVGEKIGGARKDIARELAERQRQVNDNPSDILNDIRRMPVSRIFNFDYAALRKEGVSNEVITLLQVIRDAIPSKPRTDYKLRRWADDTFRAYRACLELVTAEEQIRQRVIDGLMQDGGLGDRCRARMALGGYDAGANLGEASLRQLNSSAGHYDKNGGWVSAEGKWYVKGAGKYGGIYDTLEEATQALRDFAADSSSKPSERKTEFSVYMMRKDGTAYITIKGKPSIVVESGFKSGKEALAYLKEHYDDLVSKYDGLKEKTTVAFQENRPRKGKDWRAGKDVSAEEFREAFGFRGVEFGNWTNQADRQHALNNAYDALMDLADATGKSPRAMSLNGELGIAFGARGGGNASAHYEPEKIVINLTKTQGAGSLAHEWWHAIDNYFSRRRGDRLGYNTDRKGYSYSRERGGSFSEQERQELTQAITDLMGAIDRSSYGDRSRAYASLKSGYWSRPTELGARAFAVWVERRLSEKGAINDFLANNPSSMGWDNENVNKYYPYPMESDFVALDTAFDNLFNTIQETTDAQTGNVAMYDMSNRDTLPMTEEQKTVYDAVLGLLEEAGIQVEVLGNEQMKALGHSGNVALWTKKKSPETASVLQKEHQPTVVSSDNTTNILNHLDKLAIKYQEKSGQSKTFLGDIAEAISAKRHGSASQYATFETVNGRIVTIRLSDHNASTKNFDNAGRNNGISIVVTSKKNAGITNDGNAHIVEYYYDAIKLRKADGKPLAEIVRSIKQALYSGEYTDTTGLAVREEVNDPETIRMMTAGDSHTEDGIIYGATVGGKIYLNGAALNPETPIHEYTHIWDEACRLNNPELWDRGVELMKQTPMWDEVKNDPNYANLESDNDIASEVHSRLTGKDGAKRLENMAQKAKGKGVKVLLEKLCQWLKDFWWWLKDTMSSWTKAEVGRVSIDDFINMPLKDMLNGTDLHGRRSVEAEPSFMGDKVTREELKAIDAERRSIAEKAQKDGTWLKAPNGKASNLEPNQWVDVRTSRFKQWFGDWEKAARIEKLRHADTVKASGEEYKGKYELTNKSAAAYINDALRGEYTNKDTGLAVKITRKGAFKVTRHDAENEIHLKSIALIPQMIENAIFITEEKNTKRANSFDSYRYYVVGLNVGGVDYTAKLVAGVKKGETYYDHALTEIEKSDLISGIDEISSSFTKDKDAHLSDIKDKRLLSILQTNASKIVDENGEPMVVYHGTPKHWWHKFNIFNTKQVPGWFTSSQDYAGRYAYNGRIQVSGIHKLLKGGTIYEAFLNLQHPLYIGHLSGFYDTQEKLSSEIVKLTGFDANEVSNVISDIFEQGYEALPIWEITNSHLFKQLTQKYGYDGIIATETFNAYRSFAAFDPTQIKSATDNIGTYSPVNPDIRYHIAAERASYDDAIAEYRKQYDDLLEERDRLLQNRDNIPNFDQAVNDWRDKKAETVRALYNSIARLYGFADDTEIIVFNGERDTEAIKRIFELAHNGGNNAVLLNKDELTLFREAYGEGGHISNSKILFFDQASKNADIMSYASCVESLIHEYSHRIIESVYEQRYDAAKQSASEKDNLRSDGQPEDNRDVNGTRETRAGDSTYRSARSLYGRRGDLTDVYESVKDIPAWQKKLSPYRNKPTAQQGGEVIAYSVGELTSPRKGYAFQRFMNGEISAAEAVAALKYHTPQLDAAVTEVLEALKEGLTVQRNANGAAQTTGDLKQAADNLNAFYADTTEEESKPRRSKEERLRERITELYNEVRKNKADTREIAHTIASEIRDKMSVPLVEAMGKRDFDSIVRVMENATVKRDLEESLKRLKEIVSEVEVKALQQQANMLVSLKVQGKSRHGVSVAKTVDDNTRMTFETLQKAIAEGKSVDALDAEINEEANRIYGETSSYNPLLPKWRASQLLRSYRDGLDVRADIDNIDKETRDLREQNRELWNKRVEANRQGNAAEARLFQNGINLNKEIIESLRDERLELQERLIGHLRTFTRSANEELEYGRSILQDWKEKKEIHKREIITSAFADCGDGSKIPVLEDKTPTWVDRKDKLFDFLLSPMYSMDFLLKMISVNAPNGEGTLYDHFVRSPYGYVEARGKAWLGYEECKRRLNDKARSIFGKSYVEALSESNRDSGFNITITDGKRQQSYAPTIGEALYIYMVDKMTDGRVKLRKMGIGEAAIMQLRDNLPSQYIALVDWIQAEFLPELRIKYNNTHLEAFGTQMAEVENYVPLKIQRGTIYQEVDGTKKDVAELPTAITGSIINRRRNTALIDLHTNALDLILQHCRDMENWNAFTFVVQDMNALLSNTEFRRLLNARNKNLHKKMKVCAQIAANAYISESNTPNKAWIALSKMAAASKIAFRVNTALKQILSYPAFYAYSPNTGFWAALTRNAAPDMWAANFKWALENIPSFRERWLGRMAGDEKLSQITVPTVDKWIKKVGTLGMYPNALVDAIVCANGAKAVYDHNIKRYAGVYDETEAGRRACIDAALAINETQQSSEGLFLSQLQSDRDFWSVSLSTFQNSNFAYLRKQMEGIYQLMRNYSNQYANRVEAYEKAGLSKEQAHKRAEADIKAANRTAIGNILVFMFMLNVLWEIGNNIWLYAFGNESEEEPDMAADLGKAAAVAVVRNTTIGPVVESLANGYDANPSVLLSDLIGFGERIRRATENDPKAWNNTAAYIAARILISNGTGVDLETFANMYHGIEGMIRDGADVEDIMDLLNAPQSQAKLIAGAPKEGESMQQYAERMAFVYRRINGRIDNKDMSRWEREYRNGKIDAIYAEHGGVKKNRQIENEYGEILRLEGISRSGDFSQTLKESFRYMSDIQKENKIQLAKAAAMIRHEEKKIEGLVVFNDSYAEQLMEIQRLKQEFIEEWRKQ